MKIYIDLVFLLNFLFDFILLISVNYILKRDTNYFRMIISSLIGEVTLLFLFINMSSILLLLLKFIVSFVMILICFGYKDIRYFFKNVLYFYLVSMLLGGAIQFLDNQFIYNNNGSLLSTGRMNVNYIFVWIIGLFLFFKYIKAFSLLKNNYNYYHKCKIFFDENTSKIFNAFLDTGNKLKVAYLNKSIVLIDREKVEEIDMKNPNYVPYNSLNNHGLLECYKCLKLEIDGKIYDKFLLGISNEKFYIDGIDCIINNSVMEGLK